MCQIFFLYLKSFYHKCHCKFHEAIKVEAYVTEVTDMLKKNQLKLNREKSEAIIFLTTKQRVDLPAEVSLTIAGHRVILRSSVRNWGCCSTAD